MRWGSNYIYIYIYIYINTLNGDEALSKSSAAVEFFDKASSPFSIFINMLNGDEALSKNSTAAPPPPYR